MRVLRSLWPDTVRGQMIAIVLGAVLIVSTGNATIEALIRRDRGGMMEADDYLRRAETVALLLRHAAPAERRAVLMLAQQAGMDFALRPATEALPPPQGLTERVRALWNHVSTVSPPSTIVQIDGQSALKTPVDDDTDLILQPFPQSFVTTEILSYSLAVAILVAAFSAFAVRGISGPISRMARALDSTDRFLADDTPLDETRRQDAAREFRQLAAALNDMRARIRGMLESRTRMLRSISHDLRTPLTRLRLRLERSDDPMLTTQALADIAHVDAMIEATLRYLRDGSGDGLRERCDLPSLLQTICDDFADMGGDIAYDGPAHLSITVSVTDISRAVTNLCENALKFGQVVRVSLRVQGAMAEIDVTDDGPGIPAEMRARVLEPFVKLDESRSGQGFGLGLSITAEIAARHGGRLLLLDNHPQGLTARIALPLT